jgi:hypothetical protein
MGPHLVTPRRNYLRHGVYVGARKVIQNPGLVHGLRRGAVEEVPVAHLAHGQRVWVRRVGEDPYHLKANNVPAVKRSR